MEMERRVEQLERDVDILKGEIEQTLLDVRDNLSEKLASPSQWQKRAWGLALLNVLLALTLFTNIRLCTTDTPAGISPILVPWLRALWMALAFLWLILQMYPLALLLEQEEKQVREVAWRNAIRIFLSNPGLTLALALAVLGVAVISMLFPSFWFAVVGAMFAAMCINGMLHLLRPHRQEDAEKK